MAMVTIHGMPQSTFVRTARMTCIEKGVSHAVDPLGLGSAELRQRHPFGKIPAMTHDRVQLFETAAICRYIDEAFDGPRLQPMDTVERARMTQWISAIGDYVFSAAIRRFVLPYLFAKGEHDRAVIDAAIADMTRQFAVFDAAVGTGAFLVGDRLTLADLFLLPILHYVDRMPEGPALLGAAPNLRRWMGGINARPSAADTLPPPMPG